MTSNFDLIIPYVKPLAPLIADEEVSEIMVNASGVVFVERDGRLSAMNGLVIPERQRQAAVRNIARLLGDDIDEQRPLLDARLPDGSRVAAVMPPASVGGTILNIRKFRAKVFTAAELVRRGMMSPGILGTLQRAIEARKTILISGGTGSGKTTLLNALAAFLPQDERIVLIEDTAEISIETPNLVRLEARRAQPDMPAISIRDLLRQTLRLRPDRIILGEVRGAEAFDLLQALNTGHTGTLSTIHSNSARLAVERLRTCISVAGAGLPDHAIARNIAEVVNVLVHIERRGGHRAVCEVVKLGRYDASRDSYEFQEV
ncbi:MAG TPA: ATPase, T2SS/T4P/T4SS family [Bryobacteraceae bacterium]|nr:ATPase, T2SS/T4P/T4SS family [Bryobacteraceae bacterium]